MAHFYDARLLGLFCLSTYLGLACSPAPSTGTKTHWFRSCDVDADCDDETACLCGICSVECSSDDDCSQGQCGSFITSAGTCGSGEHRLCLPDSANACLDPLARSSDLGPPTASACAEPDALLCETFDEPLPVSYRITASADGLLLQQSCITSTGSGALSSAAPPGGAAELQMPLSEPVDAGPLYARLRIYVPSGQAPAHNAAILALRPGDAYTPEGKVIRLREDGGVALQLIVTEASLPSAPDVLPQDQWACLELELDVATSGSARVLIDGTEVISTIGETRPPSGPLTTVVAFGGAGTSSSPIDVAIDDLVVATSPIGCD